MFGNMTRVSTALVVGRRLGIVASATAQLVGPGCGGPVGPFAGGRLTGTVVRTAVADWSFANEYELIQVETRPADPYSVNVHYYVVDQRLYVEGDPNRRLSRWRTYLRQNPDLRVRFGDRVYEVTAVEVTDEDEIVSILPVFYDKDDDDPPAACLPHRVDEACPAPGIFFRLDPRP